VKQLYVLVWLPTKEVLHFTPKRMTSQEVGEANASFARQGVECLRWKPIEVVRENKLFFEG